MFGKHIHSLDDSDKVCIFFLAMFGVMMTFVGFEALDVGRPFLSVLFLFVACFLFGVAVHEMFVRNEKWTTEQIEKLLHEQQEKNLVGSKWEERETYRGEIYFPSVETVLRNKKTEELLERHDRLVQARKRPVEAYEDEDEQAADPTAENPFFKSLLCEENENVDAEPTEGTDVDMDDCLKAVSAVVDETGNEEVELFQEIPFENSLEDTKEFEEFKERISKTIEGTSLESDYLKPGDDDGFAPEDLEQETVKEANTELYGLIEEEKDRTISEDELKDPFEKDDIIARTVQKNLYDRFKYTYGKTDEEMSRWIDGEIPFDDIPKLTSSSYYRSSYANTSGENIESLSKHKELADLLTEEIMLFSLSRDVPSLPADVWKEADRIAVAINARTEFFEKNFNVLKDNRRDSFFEFFKEISKLFPISDKQIDMIICQIPYNISKDGYSADYAYSFKEAQEKYIRRYGKYLLAEDEKEFVRGVQLPLSITEIEKYFYNIGTGWKPICPKEKALDFKSAIETINRNLEDREATGLSNENIHIPSGPAASEPGHDWTETVRANALLLNPVIGPGQIVDIFLRYKTRETIIRHLMNDANLSGDQARELASFKAV